MGVANLTIIGTKHEPIEIFVIYFTNTWNFEKGRCGLRNMHITLF